MPAEMYENDTMYSVRQAPWHLGTGTSVSMLDTAPERRAERMALAGQDFLVVENDVFNRVETVDPFGETAFRFVKLPGWKLLQRSDDNGILSVQRDSYSVVQNVVGHELFEALSEGARLDDGTGGTVKGGAQCYLTARIDEPQTVKGDSSPVYPYVVVTWAHDGSGAVQARSTNVRVVCWNTLTMSEAESRRQGTNFTFRHTAKVMERIAEAKEVIRGAREDRTAFIELANELADVPVSDEQREMFVQTFIPAPVAKVISPTVEENIRVARARVRSIFDGETIPEAHRNTAYGLVTAGVEYLDHLRAHRNSDTYLGRTLLREEPLKKALVPMVRKLVNA